jgi:vancomycin aglycone glucosyltransferase
MKIAIVINGTRGDVQPMVALATGLLKNGHEIIFLAPPENKDIVERHNLRFVPFGPSYKELFKQKAGMKGGATASPSPGEMKKQTEAQIDLLPGLIKDTNLILCAGFVLGVHTVADVLKAGYQFVIFYPTLLGPTKSDPLLGRMLFGMGRSLTNLMIKRFINEKRSALGLPVINDVWRHWMGDRVIAACDKELNAVRDGVSFDYAQTGYMLLPSKQGLPEHVEKFLNNGEPPVYIGFGSNPITRPQTYVQMFRDVSESTRQRLIVSKGWAELHEDDTSEILYVDDMPFEILFPRLAAIVYHGGTGTMAAAARAGMPQVAFPFMADQFENRKQIIKLGLGPDASVFKKLSSKILISSINECISNTSYKQNAMEISRKLQDSDGLGMTVGIIEKELRK